MTKLLKIIGIVFLIFIVVGIIGSKNSPNNKKLDVKKSIEEGYKKEGEVLKKESKTEPTNKIEFTKKEAILSGKDESGKIVLQDINIWGKAGSGGIDNVTIGTVPDNTKIEVLDKKTVEGFVFYRIKSSVGKVSMLPTNFGARKKAMDKLPQSEWTVEADPDFPVDGWVIEDFVTNLK